ncbi:MAG: hypothetical protein JST28_06550 [Acidobacteria bacterium]|nr:hypothetical protein [Acidobacteriota bacterium]
MQSVAAVGGKSSTEAVKESQMTKAAHEFEAQMMKELIGPVTRLSDGDDEAGSAGALTAFAGEALGQSLSRAGSFGIAERLIATLSRIGTGGTRSSVPGHSEILAKHP